MTAPALIPLRLVYRVLHDTCHAHANFVTNRRGRHSPSAEKAEARERQRRRLLDAADAFARWADDESLAKLPGVDAAVLGFLVTWVAYGHGDSLPELRAELRALGRPGVLDAIAGDDLVRIARAATRPDLDRPREETNRDH